MPVLYTGQPRTMDALVAYFRRQAERTDRRGDHVVLDALSRIPHNRDHLLLHLPGIPRILIDALQPRALTRAKRTALATIMQHADILERLPQVVDTLAQLICSHVGSNWVLRYEYEHPGCACASGRVFRALQQHPTVLRHCQDPRTHLEAPDTAPMLLCRAPPRMVSGLALALWDDGNRTEAWRALNMMTPRPAARHAIVREGWCDRLCAEPNGLLAVLVRHDIAPVPPDAVRAVSEYLRPNPGHPSAWAFARLAFPTVAARPELYDALVGALLHESETCYYRDSSMQECVKRMPISTLRRLQHDCLLHALKPTVPVATPLLKVVSAMHTRCPEPVPWLKQRLLGNVSPARVVAVLLHCNPATLRDCSAVIGVLLESRLPRHVLSSLSNAILANLQDTERPRPRASLRRGGPPLRDIIVRLDWKAAAALCVWCPPRYMPTIESWLACAATRSVALKIVAHLPGTTPLTESSWRILAARTADPTIMRFLREVLHAHRLPVPLVEALTRPDLVRRHVDLLGLLNAFQAGRHVLAQVLRAAIQREPTDHVVLGLCLRYPEPHEDPFLLLPDESIVTMLANPGAYRIIKYSTRQETMMLLKVDALMTSASADSPQQAEVIVRGLLYLLLYRTPDNLPANVAKWGPLVRRAFALAPDEDDWKWFFIHNPTYADDAVIRVILGHLAAHEHVNHELGGLMEEQAGRPYFLVTPWHEAAAAVMAAHPDGFQGFREYYKDSVAPAPRATRATRAMRKRPRRTAVHGIDRLESLPLDVLGLIAGYSATTTV